MARLPVGASFFWSICCPAWSLALIDRRSPPTGLACKIRLKKKAQ